MCSVQLSPSFSLSMFVASKSWAMVSEVLPDLVITLNMVCSMSMTSNRDSILSGSMLSSIKSLGPPRLSLGRSL